MIALDTCVLARLLVGDDPRQQEDAVRLVEANDCSVSWTVLIELCWVLERSMMLSHAKVVAAMSALRDIERLTLPEPIRFAWCVDRYSEGSDFADMVHLASALPGSTAFATFDRKLQRQAEPPLAVRTVAG